MVSIADNASTYWDNALDEDDSETSDLVNEDEDSISDSDIAQTKRQRHGTSIESTKKRPRSQMMEAPQSLKLTPALLSPQEKESNAAHEARQLLLHSMTMPVNNKQEALPPSLGASIEATSPVRKKRPQTCKVSGCTQTSTCPGRYRQINCLSLIANGATPPNLAPLPAKVPSVSSVPLGVTPSHPCYPFQFMGNFPSPFNFNMPARGFPMMQPLPYTKCSFPAYPGLIR